MTVVARGSADRVTDVDYQEEKVGIPLSPEAERARRLTLVWPATRRLTGPIDGPTVTHRAALTGR